MFRCCSLETFHPPLLPESKSLFCTSKIWNASRICVSSLRRGHANLLCIVPILVYVLPKRARHSAFFMVWFSQPYMTTGKIIALTIGTFAGRVVSLLFNTLSRFIIAFLPRSNYLLISWLQSPSTVISEPRKRKSVTTSTFSPYVCRE